MPDAVFRKAKAKAAERGQSLKDFVTEALREKLSGRGTAPVAHGPAWMRGFGKLRALKKGTAKIQCRIDEEFGVVEPGHFDSVPGVRRARW
jgi:hypothetical protein